MLPPPPTYYEPSLLLSIIEIHSSIEQILDFAGCLKFIELVQLLRSQISLTLPRDDPGPPQFLRQSVHQFLCKCLALSYEDMKVVWQALSQSAWRFSVKEDSLYNFGQRQIECFLKYGAPFGICEFNI